jgi:formylglycine-generating enzyme required for sulfatase activity
VARKPVEEKKPAAPEAQPPEKPAEKPAVAEKPKPAAPEEKPMGTKAPSLMTLDCGNGVELELAGIPAGTFMMGSPLNESGRKAEEVLHGVTLSKPFSMGTHEVTQAQYLAVTGKNPSRNQGNDLPVENVSWKDAVEFCRLLSEKTGQDVRLPT